MIDVISAFGSSHGFGCTKITQVTDSTMKGTVITLCISVAHQLTLGQIIYPGYSLIYVLGPIRA